MRPAKGGNIKCGVCRNQEYLNPDNGQTGPCPKCASGEIQRVDVKRLSDFKCSVCGSKLEPVKTGPDPKVIGLGVVGVLAVAAGAYFAFGRSGNAEEVVPGPDSTEQVAPKPVPDPVAQPAGLSFPEGEYAATVGQPFGAPALTNPNNLAVTYSSDNEKVAAVDAAGAVTPLTEGKATITATSVATPEFEAGNASYVVTVGKKTEVEVGPKTVLGGAAVYDKAARTLTFRRSYSIDLGGRDGSTAYASSGDRLYDVSVSNGRIVSGILKSGGDERYLSGLNIPVQ